MKLTPIPQALDRLVARPGPEGLQLFPLRISRSLLLGPGAEVEVRNIRRVFGREKRKVFDQRIFDPVRELSEGMALDRVIS